jgi:signal transduction histidine kinase/DNA-binding response OmpR family regulator/HAMP domain-containing protein
MRLTFRAKLIAIVAVDALALLALVLLSNYIERRVDNQLASIREHYVPRIGLGPRLEGTFDKIGRSLQDAVAANDLDLLEDARKQHQLLVEQLAAAGDAVDPADAAALRAGLDTYVSAGVAVSRRIIAGEADEDMVAEMQSMQVEQARAAELLANATRFDQRQLAEAFHAASEVQRTGARIRMAVSAACLCIVIILTIWIGRGLFRTLGDFADGFRRFGDGDFTKPIPAAARDELGDAAREANQMADRLRALMTERDRQDWLKGGHAGLVESLRGELEPAEVADRAVAFLARHLGAPVGALYYMNDSGNLALLGRYGFEVDPETPTSFVRGEGLVGQAALEPEITVIDAPTGGGLRLRTGAVEGHPRSLAFIPLVHLGSAVGVIELVLLEPWTERAGELAMLVREAITVTIEVARARTATRTLLAKTQRQAAELLDARAGLLQKADELTRASAYKSQFLANMSHELRTPMNAIIGFSELLHDDQVPAGSPQHKEFTGYILESGRHLLRLINDVLDLSKVEAGKLEFHPETFSVESTVNELLAIMRTTAATRRVRVVPSVDPAVTELLLDPARFKQVLYNFLSNALKFTPEGGRVDVRVLPEGAERFRLEVADTGAGIAPADLERLFVEFQQVGADAKKAGGTGLGLALTKRLVEAQGGTVGVRSTVGEGSVFHAILPRRIAAAPAVALPALAAIPADAPRVLVIEDDRRDQSELATALANAGYAVEVASTGALALQRAREQVFEAITLDLLLPDMTGLEVLRQLRSSGKNQQVPVIVVTVVAEPGAVAGFAVHDVLPKPLDVDHLLESLLRAEVSPSANRTVLVVDDDPASLEIMSHALQRLGYRARCERDGERALGAVRASLPTAIILDLIMPGMSGFEFLDQLRADPSSYAVPVIVWTGKELSKDEHTMLRASASAVVSKGHGGSSGVLAELTSRIPRRRETAPPRHNLANP